MPDASPRPAGEGASKRICIGKISSSHGVKGLVKILPYCEDLSLLQGKLYTAEKGNETLDISIKNNAGKYLLAEIDGITSREQAQILKHSLYIPREELPNIADEDSFYITDLAGLSVLSENNTPLGKIKAIQNFGAGDLIEIHPPSGASYFVPFQDEYIQDVDLDKSTITLINADRFKIE
ncbi:MAG: ribosome maturation factor RimM [Alphaproteobacteria bacterium]